MPPTVSRDNGICVRGDDGFEMRLDPRRGEGLFFVSHAHSDHKPSSIRDNGRIICSDETFEMLSILGLKTERAQPENVKLLDAGHIVGSRMALIEVDGKTVLFTGDFNSRKRYFLDGAKPAKCDILIMESTYSSSACRFPQIDELESSVKTWLDSVERAVLVGYNLGKAQILTAMANELGYVPACQSSVFATNRLVEKLGHKIGFYEKYSPDSENLQKVVIATPDLSDPDISRLLLEKRSNNNNGVADFTGWSTIKKKSRYGGQMSFPLSDHSGFDDLLGFVRGCSPEKIFLVHGKGADSALQKELKKEGFDVEYLSRKNKTVP